MNEPTLLRDTASQDRPLDERHGRRRRARWIVAGLCVALAIALVITSLLHFSGVRSSVSRSSLTIATVERGLFMRDVVADGQVVAAVSPTLYAPSSGSVTLQVHAGDTVRKEQIVAVVTSPDVTARLSQEQSSLDGARLDWERAQLDAENRLARSHQLLAQSEVDLKTMQRELERSRKAYELGSYSELQMLRAQDALEKAQFAEQQARAQDDTAPAQARFDVDSKRVALDRQRFLVEDLRRQVDALQIRSPVDGSIGQVQIADRATVARDAPLLTVVDLTALEVEIKVPESLARDLAPGMGTDVQGNGRHYQGHVSGISPQVVNGEVTARIRFDDQKSGDLRQNQRLSVRILIDQRDNTLMVERGDFLDRQGGAAVYVVRDNIAQRRSVQLGAASAQKVEILGGLAVGDKVVVSGADAFNGADRVALAH
ncbi:MAG TPA: efflux RND transporter periplasmic adaptor subunit [Steroidobacteraceae bacterium]|jgi:HlyD family secretion protein|nr:efflux RND transporter periplasmic adaptor subunit [Steroidobacteraceae bacterium]